jgi:hypothetical protein
MMKVERKLTSFTIHEEVVDVESKVEVLRYGGSRAHFRARLASMPSSGSILTPLPKTTAVREPNL